MPGFPCCCTGCDIASDEFDRASVGAGWTQVAGTWAISSNRLETSDSDALAIFATDHPEESSSHHISVLGQVSDTESKIRGVVAYDSADDYLSVELMINTSDCSEIKFFERVGGSTSQVGDTRKIGILATGTDYRLEVCFQDDTYPNDGGELCVKLSLSDGSHSWTFCESSITATGDQVGLGTGTLTSSGSASFESFEWNKSKKDQGSCPDCKGSTCLLLEDAFTRADSTDLGCNWTETSGSWEIDDNELVTSSASAQATTTMTNFRPEYGIIGGTVRFGTGPFDTDALGDVARMMLDVDGSNSHALQITCGVSAPAPGFGKVELLKGTTVLATVVKVIQPGVDWNFTVCLQDAYIETDIHSVSGSGVVGDQLHLDAVTTPYGGDKAALGTGSGNSSIVTFDYFIWQRAKNSDDMDCPSCIDEEFCGACEGDVAPSLFKVAVSGFSPGAGTQEVNRWDCPGTPDDSGSGACPDCECECDINGTFILSKTMSTDTECRWEADAPNGSFSCGPYGAQHVYLLQIGHDGTNHFVSLLHINPLSIAWNSGPTCGTVDRCNRDYTYWRRDFQTKPDCLSIFDMELPFHSTNQTWHENKPPGQWLIGKHDACFNDDYLECVHDESSVRITAL